MPQATIADVATLAGVSRTTVSHALSGRRPVSKEVVARVRAAAAELGYRPSQLARSLRLRRTQTVALVVPDIANPFYPTVARGVHDAIAAHGFHTVICSTDGERTTEREYLQEMLARSVDGIVVFPFALEPADLAEVVASEVPIVVARGGDNAGTDQVYGDDATGAAAATAYLLATGIRRIVAIAGPVGHGPGDQRLAGFHAAMRAAGVTVRPEQVVRCDYSVAGGHKATTELLSRPDRPRAVVCANDLVAIGALDATRAAGLRVPEDLAVVGFDDIDAASLVTPALTTVLNPAHEIGRQAGQLLMDRLVGVFTGPPRDVSIPTTLIRRASA